MFFVSIPSRLGRAALCTIVFAVVATVALSSAAAASGNLAVTGHGTAPRVAPYSASFRFAAEGSPDGSAHGFYTQTLSSPSGPSIFGTFSGEVTCLEVLPGDLAVLGGIVTQTTDPRFTAGWSFWVSVHDGRPTNTPDSTSLVELSNTPEVDFGPGFPATSCNAPLLATPPFVPITDGQITIAP